MHDAGSLRFYYTSETHRQSFGLYFTYFLGDRVDLKMRDRAYR